MSAARSSPGDHPLSGPAVVEAVAADGAASALTRLAAICDGRSRRQLIAATAEAPGGLRALLDLREAVLTTPAQHPDCPALGADLDAVLAHRFTPTALVFGRIGADAPPSVLDTIVQHDTVHPVRSPDDLARRLDPRDRRCFAMVHPELGPEPLVFVEVALTFGIETSVEAILDAPPPVEPPDADTAMFYAIVKCEPGLRGIPIGAELLQRAMDELLDTTPVARFCTLSPLPGLAAWADPTPDDPDQLLVTAARYLLEARRGDEPADPVARFHLGNGASVERITVEGDRSESSRSASLGLTVNYLYDRRRQREHRAAYDRGEVVASAAVRSLVEGP